MTIDLRYGHLWILQNLKWEDRLGIEEDEGICWELG